MTEYRENRLQIEIESRAERTKDEERGLFSMLRALRKALRNVLLGRLNTAGEFICREATTTTTVPDDQVRAGCSIVFTPLDTNAAGLVAGGMYISAQVESSIIDGVDVGYFEVTHPAPASDALFTYHVQT